MKIPDFELYTNKPLKHVVLNKLRKMILKGELKPGERLVEAQFANIMGVSRTPIRQALHELAEEGLVLLIPRQGAEVAGITEQNFCNVLEVRRALETLCVCLACNRVTEEQILELKIAEQEFEDSLESGEITQIAAADAKFHDVIYNAADNSILFQILNNLQDHMYRCRLEYLKQESIYSHLMEEHGVIIKKIEMKEEAGAARAVSQHIDNQMDAVSDIIWREEKTMVHVTDEKNSRC